MTRPSSLTRLATATLAILGHLLISLQAGATPLCPSTVSLTNFTAPPNGWNYTIGFCYAGNRFVGSVGVTPFPNSNASRCLYQCRPDGTNPIPLVAPPYTIPNGPTGEEHMVASSLGLAGWPYRDIYVGFGGSGYAGGIYHINQPGGDPPARSSSTLLLRPVGTQYAASYSTRVGSSATTS